MSANDPLARPLSAWLHEEAAYHVPDHLAEVLRQTAATRQRPAWSSLERWLPLDTTVRPHLVMLPRLGRVLLVAALIIALAALAIVAAGSYRRLPDPFGLAANGEIAYAADGDILVADPDGTHDHAVVSGPSTDFAVAYTRDGTGLMFLRAVSPHEATLMIAAPDGSRIRLDHAGAPDRRDLVRPVAGWSVAGRRACGQRRRRPVHRRYRARHDAHAGRERTGRRLLGDLAAGYHVAVALRQSRGFRRGDGGGHLLHPGRWQWPDTHRAVRDGPGRVPRRRCRT